MFDPVDPKQRFPELEKGILQYWKEEDIFKRSIRKEHDVFSFYDGPPFATGLPHYGHLLAGTIKDVIPRYQTMRGKRVERRFGWDCHGLPVENLVEQEEGLKSKKDIEERGIKWFNDKCRASVMRYTNEWKKTVERTGRWVDMDHDYRTMDPTYMESIWWTFSELYRKGLIYEGKKAMHICPRCVTPLSNFEVTQGYREIEDVTVTVKFQISNSKLQTNSKFQVSNKTYFLAWTTTPWTLPGNLFLAVHPDLPYAMVRVEGDDAVYIVAEPLVGTVFAGREHSIVEHVRAADLIGARYEPLFPYFADEYESAFRVVPADFVAANEGTGIVHIAPGFGEDDYQIGKREGVSALTHIGMDGRFIDAVADFAGEEVKPAEEPSRTDRKIIQKLQETGRLFSQHIYRHSYPHCWRCDSPLLNYATSSWFVAVEKIKKDIIKLNSETRWVPEHIRDGRFGEWLKNAKDWAISRNRYWGTPLPIWRATDAECSNAAMQQCNNVTMEQCNNDIVVIGSRDELMSKCPIRFTKVTVLRHAESEGNVKPIYQGEMPGTNLTARGREKAAVAGQMLANAKIQKFKNSKMSFFRGQFSIFNFQFSIFGRKKSNQSHIPITIIYSSPLARTRQTAEIIAKKTGAKVIIDERLREVRFGDWEGKTVDFSDLAFVKKRRAHKFEKERPESIYHMEGMETWENVQLRIKDFLDETLPRHRGEHIAIVTHADPVQNIAHYFTREDPVKISHQPYPKKAESHTFFWDHERGAEMDLHKDTVDGITWGMEKGQRTKDKGQSGVEVTLVRHGETDWNAEHRVQGHVDQPLNEQGRRQSKECAQQLQGQKFDVVLCSTLLRSSQTAAILAKELGVSVIQQWDDLRERDMGDLEGKSVAEIFQNNLLKQSVEGMRCVGFHYGDLPHGETFNHLVRRAAAVRERILSECAGKRILIVGHGALNCALIAIIENLTYREAYTQRQQNAEIRTFILSPLYRRIPEVLDCWFESGAMPYAQGHWPFEGLRTKDKGQRTKDKWILRPYPSVLCPHGFPADFIAEGLDQTRGWFYTLMVLSAALYKKPAFKNCIVNGIVLAEDGKKMSKRLKNYPEPDLVMEKYGADAMRFTLMSSPAVRGESLRFSEKAVEETVRRVILPLWNAYGFFVMHANASPYPSVLSPSSRHSLDRWIMAELQDLVNRMTTELDRYDLSATCGELYNTLDALTNWYIRRSRRRFAGKEGVSSHERESALATLHTVLLTFSKLLAPFCPFITEAIYMNLVEDEHGSIHMTAWPTVRELMAEEREMIAKMRLLRTIVSLGMGLRAEANVKVRQPLQKLEVVVSGTKDPSASLRAGYGQRTRELNENDCGIIAEELNVKEVQVLADPSRLARCTVRVNARALGPRLGAKVQDVIRAAKEGKFVQHADGTVTVLGEKLTLEEASIVYEGEGGRKAACRDGVVVRLETAITDELKLEGLARDVIRSVQALRKKKGLNVSDRVTLEIVGTAPHLLERFKGLIESETNGSFAKTGSSALHVIIDIRDRKAAASACFRGDVLLQ